METETTLVFLKHSPFVMVMKELRPQARAYQATQG